MAFMYVMCAMNVDAATNQKTKSKVDELKSSIPYPEHNIGDILYIAFITDPDVALDYASEADLEVRKVRIVDMRLCNTFAMVNGESYYGVFLSGVPVSENTLEWSYQYVDTRIRNPKVRDFSIFYSENRFGSTPLEAKKKLLNHSARD